MTATADVRALCRELGGLQPDPSVSDGEWAEWLAGFGGVVATPAARKCPKCGGLLVERRGKFGAFRGCENYPTCKHSEKL